MKGNQSNRPLQIVEGPKSLKLYKQLSKKSQEVFLRVKEGQTTYHDYQPRIDLVRRLARDNYMSPSQVVARLNYEREYLLRKMKKIASD